MINEFCAILRGYIAKDSWTWVPEHPEALKVLEARGEEKALEVLDSFSEKFPEAIVIEVGQVEELLEKTPVKKALETRGFEPKLNGRIM